MSDEQDLTICGGRQSYMDFFSEVFCVVIFTFFFFSFFCTQIKKQKYQDGKHYQRVKEKNKTKLGVTFPNTDSVKALNEQLY